MNSPVPAVLRAERESSVQPQPPKEADNNASLPRGFPTTYLPVHSAAGSQGDQKEKPLPMGTNTV